ncbi:hypothetical protein ACFL2J_02760 [Candidatus Omnitrophota bacterium]
MKNTKRTTSLFIFLLIQIIFFVFGVDRAIAGEIMEIEKDNTYMVPLGTQDGAKTGDIVEVSRDGESIAQVRLMSALPDSSMAQVVSLLDSSGIQAQDKVELSDLEYSEILIEEAPIVTQEVVVPKAKKHESRSTAATSAYLDKQFRRTEVLLNRLDKEKAKLETRLEQKEIEIVGLKQEIKSFKTSYQDKVNDLSSKLRDSESSFNLLERQHIADLKRLEKEYEVVITRNKGTGEKLAADLRKLEVMFANVSKDKIEFGSELSTTKDELGNVARTAAQLEKTLASKDSSLLNSQDEVYRLREEILDKEQSWQGREDDLKREYLGVLSEQKKESQKKLKFEKGELQKQIESLNVQLDQFPDKIKTERRLLEETIVTLNTQLTSLRKSSKDDLEQLEKRWQYLLEVKKKEFDARLATQKAGLEKKLIDREDELIGKINELEAIIKDLNAASSKGLDSLSAKLGDEKAQKVAFKERSAELTDRLGQREREITRLEKNISSLQDRLALARDSLKDKADVVKKKYEQKLNQQKQETKALLVKQREADEKKKEDLEGQIVKLKSSADSRVDKLRVGMREKDAVIISLKNEKVKLLANFRDRDRQISDLKDSIAKAKEELAASNKEWQNRLDIVTQKEGLSSDLSQLTNALREKDASISSLKSENETLKKYLNRRDDDLDDLKYTVAGLKRDLGVEGASASGSFKPSLSSSEADYGKGITSESKLWYNEKEEFEQYYYTIREQIFDKLRNVDFSAYKGKISYVKVEFELYPSGLLKDAPRFYGTRDKKLKNILSRSFQQALPFPKFPESLNKSSQRFIIAVSFE